MSIEFMVIGFVAGLYCLFYICRKIQNDKVNEKQIREKIRKYIKETLDDSDQFNDISIPSFTLFIEECIEYLYKKISKTIPNNSMDLSILNDELHSSYVYNSLIDIYLSQIAETIKQANQHEDEAIEYHNRFGEEPEGDPELHPKIKDNQNIISDKYPSIQDLIKTGTVENL